MVIGRLGWCYLAVCCSCRAPHSQYCAAVGWSLWLKLSADIVFHSPQQSGAIISQLLIPPTNLPAPNTTRASRKAESLAVRFRRAVLPAKVILTEEAAKAWRLRDQREWALAKRSARLTAATASTAESRAKVPRVNMKAVFDSYQSKRQRHSTNLYEAYHSVRSSMRRKGNN